MNLIDFRKQYPQYDDISDEELANSLYSKFYSDIPREQFFSRILPKPSPEIVEAQQAATAGEEYWTGGKKPTPAKAVEQQKTEEYQPPVTPEEQMAEAQVTRGFAEARQPSITETLPPGAPVSERPLEMPRARAIDERTPYLLGLGAVAEEAVKKPAPVPTRVGPTLEAARQLEQQRLVQLANENIGDIEAARREVTRLYEEYPDLSQPKEQDILTYSALSSGARFIANMGDALYMAAEAGEKNVINPDLVDAVKPGIVTSLQNLAATLFPRDEEGKIKRLDLAERFDRKSKELAPSILNRSFDDSWDNDQASTWLAAKIANSADSAGLLAATVLVPKLAPVTMPIFFASAAGGVYAEDRAAGRSIEQATLAAQVSGAAEVAFESLDALMFRGAGKALGSLARSMSAAEKEAFAASLVGRAIKGMAVTSAASLGGGLSESATSVVQDLSKKYISERDPGDMARNAKEAFIVGAAMGPLFSAIGAAPAVVQRAEEMGAERAAEQARTEALAKARTLVLPSAPVITPTPIPPPAAPPARTMEQVRQEVQAAPDLDTAIAAAEQAVAEVQPARQAALAEAARPEVARPEATAPAVEAPELTNEQLLAQIGGVVSGEGIPAPRIEAPPTGRPVEAVEPRIEPAATRIEVPPTGRIEPTPEVAPEVTPRIQVPPTGRAEPAAPEAPKKTFEVTMTSAVTQPRTYTVDAGSAAEANRLARVMSVDMGQLPPSRSGRISFKAKEIPTRAETPTVPGVEPAAPRVQAAPVVEPAAPSIQAPPAVEAAAPAPAAFTDFTAKQANKAKGIQKGEIVTFPTEKQAAAYVQSNKIRGYTPRETEDGWVLSKPVKERTPAQIAAARQRMRVREDDDLLTAMAKMGGLNATSLESDGADPADLKSLNRTSVLKPFRRNGGMSVDAAAERMAEMGYDVYDENGNVDATKARDILNDAIMGEKVYTPAGYEIIAAKDAEGRAKFEAQKEREAIAIVNETPAMAEDELLQAAAQPREVAPEVPVEGEIPPGAVRLEEVAPGEFVVATPQVQQENIDQAFTQAETQVRQGATAQYGNAETAYETRGPSDQSVTRVSEPSPEYAVRRRGGGVQLRAGGFHQTLGEQGHLGLLGQTLDSPAKLAELAQIYRNPAYEIFRVFFVDGNGRVVEQTGVSARLPGQAGFLASTESTQIFGDWVQARMDKNGSEGFYILHNHPSGDPTPSSQDAAATRAVAANGFLGHIVIDSNRFAKIDANGEYEILPLQKFSLQDPVRRQLIQNGVIGTPIAGDSDVAKIGRLFATSEDMSVVIAQGASGITAIGEIPNQTLLDPQRGPAAIRRFARFNGGAQIFIYTQPANRTNPNVVRLWDQGFATDIVSGNGESIFSERGASPNEGSFGGTKTRVVQQLGEERAIQEPSPETLPVREGARGGEAVGQRDTERQEAAREGRAGEAGAEEVRPAVVNWAKKEFGDRVAPNGNPVWQNFVRWARNAPMVTARNALSYDFKTGQPFVAESFHGTNAEEDFEVFDAAKGGEQTFADSARQGFFSTSETEVATGYATNIGAGRVFTMMLNGAPDFIRNDPEAIRLDEEKRRANEEVSKAYDNWYQGVTDNINKRFAKTAKQGEEPTVFTYEQGKRIAVGLGWENKNEPLFPPGAIDKIENAILARDEADSALSKYISDRVVETIPSRIIPLYVRMENPMVFDAEGKTPADFPLSERIAKAKEDGHDGVVFKNIADPSPVAVHYVTFNDNDLKSAVGNNGNFSTEPSIVAQPSIPYNQKAELWFSELSRQIANGPESMPAAQWKGWIANQKGIKKDEVFWTGLEDWLALQTGKVSKKQIQEFLDEKGVRVAEVVLGAGRMPRLPDGWSLKPTDDYNGFGDAGFVVRDQNGDEMGSGATEREAMREAADPNELPGTVDTKFQQYTLPGGENYREVLLTLPEKAQDKVTLKNWRVERFSEETGADYDGWEVAADMPDGTVFRSEISIDTAATEAEAIEQAKRVANRHEMTDAGARTNYRSTHWSQPNVIAHIRMNDRTDADGKRVLFVEEIQSDWGQEGRKRGFAAKTEDLSTANMKASAVERGGEKVWLINTADGKFVTYVTDIPAISGNEDRAIAAARKIVERQNEVLAGVPSAPFVTTTEGWVNLSLKRILMMAAQEGYDKVAFINGEQSADRYDLSKQIDRIDYYGDERLIAYGKDGSRIFDKQVQPSGLEEYIGKEAAERLVNSPLVKVDDPISQGMVLRDKRVLKNADLKVGGEGMKAFYDQIVPAAVNKLLAKVNGGRMATVNVATEKPITQAEIDAAERRRDFNEAERLTRIMERQQLGRGTEEAGAQAIQQQPGFDVTPRLVEQVSGGMAVFQPQLPYGNTVRYNVNDPTRADDIIRVMQDRGIDMKRVIQKVRASGTQVKETFDPYLQEGLYVSRVAARDDLFRDTEWLPLLKDIGARNLTREDVEQYLHARHAPSRNREMAKRNPTRAELDAKIQEIRDALRNAPAQQADALRRELSAWEAVEPFRGTEEERQSLSGMSTQAAMDYMNSLSPEKRADLEAVAARVDAIIAKTRQMLIDGGVDSKDSFNDNFEYYVPLYREGHEEAGGGYGQGYSVRGKTTKTATGSTRNVVDILASIAAARALAVTRVEKNRIANAMLGLALTAPDASLWAVDKVPKVPTLDKATGKVVMRGNPNYGNRDNVIVARVPDGKGNIVERAVVFNENSARAMAIAAYMKKLDADALGGFEARLAAVTRFIASMNTQYNPIFGVVNLLRDVQGAAVNLSDTPLAGKQVELVKTSTKMLSEIWLELRAQRRGETRDTEYSRLFEEFKAEGGQTGFRSVWGSREEATREIEKAIKRIGAKGAAGAFYKTSDALAAITKHALSDYNQTLENTIRLAAYKMAKDSGMSKAESAMLAKDITVNFNRKGTISTKAGAYYAFFNASVQGTARLGRVLDIKFNEKGYPTVGKRGMKIIAGGVSIGMLQAMMLAAAGYDEDEPPDFVKEKNFIIPFAFFDKYIDVNKLGLDAETMKNKYITFPMPLGLNILPNLGRISTELVLSGFKDPVKKAGEMIKVSIDAFNPLGSSTLAQTIAPTTLDPFVALYENKDWTGKPIYRESLDKFEAKPGFERAKDNASYFGLMVAKGLNRLSGGTDYTSGLFPSVLSPTPDQIDYLVGQALGGVGRELTKVQKTISAQVTGEELPPYQIPLLSRFYGEVRNKAAEGQKFYDNVKELLKYQREVTGMAEEIRRREEEGQDAEKIRDDLDAYIEKNPQYELAPAARSIMREVQQIRARKREAMKAGADKEEIKEFEEAITQRMSEFNAVVKEFGK